MALRFIDGFDNYQSIGGVLTGVDFPNIGYSITATNTSLATIAQGTSTASKCIVLGRSTNGTASMTKQVDFTGATTISIGFAMNANGRDRIFSVTNLFNVDWLTTGYPKINNDTGPTIPILNTWYYYEFVIDRTASTVTMWLNGYQQFSSSITTTIPDVLELGWGWTSTGTAATLKIDDLYIVDDADATSKYKTRLGPIEVATRFPTSNGTVQWSPTPSSKQNWQIVSQVPANTLEYVQSNVVGAVDTYISSTTVTGDVIAVAVSTLAAKADVDNHSIAMLIEQSSVQKEGSDVALSLQYSYAQTVFEKDVNDVAWTADSVNAARFGMKVK